MAVADAVNIKDQIALDLAEARRMTERLLDPIDDERLMAQANNLMSPLAWDYAHAGVYEELWLVHELAGTPFIDERYVHLYDAFENPRSERGSLPLMTREQTRVYRDEVRIRALDILDRVNFTEANHLLRDAYVYRTVVEHEHQHDETILQALQLLPGGYNPPLPPVRQGIDVHPDMVHVPAGTYPIGSRHHEPWDNEHPNHHVTIAAFHIDRFPVSNKQYLEFMDAGGYQQAELWSAKGWEFIQSQSITSPKGWLTNDSGWSVDRFGHIVPLDLKQPVMHICYYEADAFARWAGKRLPTEYEWEVAASWDPTRASVRRYPWGDGPPTSEQANLGQESFGCAQIGAYPQGASAFGCEHMAGDVWEWTSSDFFGYTGFQAYPYKEYSEVFFGPDYKVLRGASWAAQPTVARCTFRNWDYPIRRQIFAGIRCCSDGGHE